MYDNAKNEAQGFVSVGSHNTGRIFSQQKINFANITQDDIIRIDGNFSEPKSEKVSEHLSAKISEKTESVLFENNTPSPKNSDKFYKLIKQQKFDLITSKLSEFWNLTPE